MPSTTLRRLATAAVLLVVLNGCRAVSPAESYHSCMGKELLTASGSTAQALAMDRFIAAYETACPGHSLSYTPNGSGAGVSDFLRGYSDFAGTDSPVIPGDDDWAEAEERCGGAAPWNLPLVFGPIALTYNIFGVESLNLDGPTTAQIFTGRVRSWDAPEVAALNPDQKLPHQPITVLFRGDASGTTDNFQRYLQAAAGEAWGRGAGKYFNGGIGRPRQGNMETAAAVPRTPGAVTYAEWSFVQQQQLPAARIITTAGPDPVALTVESASSSIAGIRVIGRGHDLRLDTAALYQPTRRGAYPIMLATYELVCSKYPDRETTEAIRGFLRAAVSDGQYDLTGHGYVPLPDALIGRLTEATDAIAWARGRN